MEKWYNWIIVGWALVMSGCYNTSEYFPKKIASVEIPIVRFDQALMNVNRATAHQDIAYLMEEYEEMMPVFMEDILGINRWDTAYLAQALPDFLEDTVYGFHQTNMDAKVLFSDTRELEQELNRGFARIHYLYPDWILPTVYFYISGFNASLLFVNDDIAVGVDMYLGSDYPMYNRVVYDYQKLTMRKECIPTDIISAYLFRNIPYTSTKSRLLENMIYRGKIMYLLSLIMDQEDSWEVMGYTKEQWKWCEEYERSIWYKVMDQKDLFKTENMVLTSYLNDGPFTADISQEAPARLGTWLGWRIVASYMKHHPQVRLQELMAEGDAQYILENSYYKP